MVLDIILSYLEVNDISIRKLQKTCGISEGYLNNMRKNNADLSEDKIQVIITNYPDLKHPIREYQLKIAQERYNDAIGKAAPAKPVKPTKKSSTASTEDRISFLEKEATQTRIELQTNSDKAEAERHGIASLNKTALWVLGKLAANALGMSEKDAEKMISNKHREILMGSKVKGK